MSEITTEKYKETAKKGIENQVLQNALANLQERLGKGTAAAYRRLPEGSELRFRGHDIRMNAIENLDVLLETLAENIRKNGGHVFLPRTGKLL